MWVREGMWDSISHAPFQVQPKCLWEEWHLLQQQSSQLTPL